MGVYGIFQIVVGKGENFLEILFTVNLIYIIELHFRYRDIVNNKTSYYSFYSPIKIACLLADQPLVPSQWKSLAFKSGYLFQAQVTSKHISYMNETIINIYFTARKYVNCGKRKKAS